jgi:hypothetical protein
LVWELHFGIKTLGMVVQIDSVNVVMGKKCHMQAKAKFSLFKLEKLLQRHQVEAKTESPLG